MRLSVPLGLAFGFLATSLASRAFWVGPEAVRLATIVRRNECDPTALSDLNSYLGQNYRCTVVQDAFEERICFLKDLGLPYSKYEVQLYRLYLFSGASSFPVVYRNAVESPDRDAMNSIAPVFGQAPHDFPDEVSNRIFRDLFTDPVVMLRKLRLVSKRWRNLIYMTLGQYLESTSDAEYMRVAKGLLNTNLRLRVAQTLMCRWSRDIGAAPPGSLSTRLKKKAMLIQEQIEEHPVLETWLDGVSSSAVKERLGLVLSSTREDLVKELQATVLNSTYWSAMTLALLWCFIGCVSTFPRGYPIASILDTHWSVVLSTMSLVFMSFMHLLPGRMGGARVVERLRAIGSEYPVPHGVFGSIGWTYFLFAILYGLFLAAESLMQPWFPR